MFFALLLAIPLGALYGLKEGEIYGLETAIYCAIAVIAGILMFAPVPSGGNIAMGILAVTAIIMLFRLGIVNAGRS